MSLHGSSLTKECIELIAEFVGLDVEWKRRFSNDVLPKINKGWKEIGICRYNGPCVNCYYYQDHPSQASFDGLCESCYNDQLDGFAVERVMMNFEDLKYACTLFRCLDTFEEYQRYSKLENQAERYLRDIQGMSLIEDENLYVEHGDY